MDIYLIRHTQTATPKGLCYGQTDVPLADSFAQDFIALQNKLPQLANDCRIISSPLNRCLQLAQQFSRPVEIELRLLEINFGQWEGLLFDDIEPTLLRQWTDDFVGTSPPQGESFTQLRARVSNFWQDLTHCEHAQIFIISHAGVIRALLAHILEMPSALAFRFRVDYGSVSKIQYLQAYPIIQYCNL